jgi:hypothetical protein
VDDRRLARQIERLANFFGSTLLLGWTVVGFVIAFTLAVLPHQGLAIRRS